MKYKVENLKEGNNAKEYRSKVEELLQILPNNEDQQGEPLGKILTLSCRTTYIYVVPHHQPPDVAFYIFIQQIYVQNILNMLHTLRFFLFKMPFIS